MVQFPLIRRKKNAKRDKKLHYNARPANQNAKKKFVISFPENYDLKNKEQFDDFYCNLIEVLWKNNPMDSQLGKTIKDIGKFIAELRGWIIKTPSMTITQVQSSQASEKVIGAWIHTLPSDLKNACLVYVQKQAKLERDRANLPSDMVEK